MSTEIVKVNAKWLKWARTSVKYEKEDVASKLNINPEKITEWEETGELTKNELMALSNVYEVSPYTFFDGNDPVYDEDIPDFRTINSKKIKITPEIMFELRRVKENRNTLLNFEDEFYDFEFPIFSLNTIDSDNPDIVAKKIRNLLNMSRSNSHRKLDYWIKLIESLGVLVFEFYNIEPEQLRGYALYYDKLPIIGINHKESTNAKKFTLFHELAHLIMKKDGISNINEYSITNNDEAYCNKVAAEVLLPSNLFEKYIEDNTSYKRFRTQDIKGLSKLFNVSNQVIVRKALDLGFIKHEDYNERINEFNEYINPPKKNSPNKSSNNKPKSKDNKPKDSDKGLHNKAKIALRKNGNYFTSLLIKAYEEELITDVDMALELNVSLQVMSKIISIMIEEELYAFS